MRHVACLVVFGLSFLPAVDAHAAPDPLDNEVHLLADGGDDTYSLTGGLDLQDLFAREAWYRPREAEGVIFRMIVYGSATPGDIAGTLRLTLDWTALGGEGTLVLSSSDGLTYTAEGADLVEASMESDGNTVQGSIQIFVPYDALGAAPGQAIEGFTWRSWVGEDLRDVAPGGRPVPGSQGQVEVPEESTEVTPALVLAGPRGYTRSTARLEDDVVVVDVQNLITTTGQHILVELPDEATGWTLGEPQPAGAAVAAGEHPGFRFTATADGEAPPLTIHVTSDLGGREALVIQSPGSDGRPAQTNETGNKAVEPSGGKGAPGLGVGILFLAVMVLAGSLRPRAR